MARRTKKNGRVRSEQSRRPVVSALRPDEAPPSRAAVSVTVGWMLSGMATMVLTVAWGAAHVYVSMQEATAENASLFAGVALFSALVASTLSLALVPAVYRLQPRKPPATITVVAVAIAVLPWFAAAWTAWAS